VSELPEEYFRYKLKGVVVHTGSADSGHYYSFIEDGERNWFEFNDSSVSAFDVKNLPE
jgi:ubiquitin C-terminal hydrolase